MDSSTINAEDSKIVGIHGWTEGHVLITYEGLVHVITPCDQLDQVDLLEKNAGNSKLTYWKISQTLSHMMTAYFGFIITWMFSQILTNGHILLIEPNRVIAVAEWYMGIGLMLFGLYGLYKSLKSC